jgi:hypothetical protein
MVNVTNRPYVAVRLCPLKFLFRHLLCSSRPMPITLMISSMISAQFPIAI